MTNLILGWLNGRRKSGLSLGDLYHLDEAMGWNGDEGDDIGQVNIVLSSYQLGCLQEMMAYLQLAYYTNPQLGHEGLTNAQVRAGLNRICHAIKLGYWVLDFQDITVLFRHRVKG
ncbi:hypothetical protein [Larkinella arboricola]|nr:hypothetical protein [Larkinella arboricola]